MRRNRSTVMLCRKVSPFARIGGKTAFLASFLLRVYRNIIANENRFLRLFRFAVAFGIFDTICSVYHRRIKTAFDGVFLSCRLSFQLIGNATACGFPCAAGNWSAYRTTAAVRCCWINGATLESIQETGQKKDVAEYGNALRICFVSRKTTLLQQQSRT